MEPYYQDDWTVLYKGDCLEVLPQLEKHSVDVLITDPPYGMAYQSHYRATQFDPIINDDTTAQELTYTALRLSLDVLKPWRHIYVFGKFSFTGLPVSQSVELIWDKGEMGLGNLSLPWGSEHEYIQFGVLVLSNKNRQEGRGRLAARLRRGSILRYDKIHGSLLFHPTEKPVKLLRELVESSSCFGETVLDPFAGAGSTLVAAKLEGRKSIGIELEEKYCEIAARRLQQVKFLE